MTTRKIGIFVLTVFLCFSSSTVFSEPDPEEARPFLGKWSGMCQLSLGANDRGTQTLTLIVYQKGGELLVDSIRGPYGNNCPPERNNSLRAEIRYVDGNPCLVYKSQGGSREFSWKLIKNNLCQKFSTAGDHRVECVLIKK